jgi:hypothetical protein
MMAIKFQISPRFLSIASILSFCPVAISFFLDLGVLKEYFGILFHILLFFLVPKLDAPDVAKFAGYGWLVLDVCAGVISLGGHPPELASSIRLAGHIFAGIWIIGASQNGPSMFTAVGCILGTWLIGFTLASPFISRAWLASGLALMITWLIMVAFQNGNSKLSAAA